MIGSLRTICKVGRAGPFVAKDFEIAAEVGIAD